MKTVKCSVNEAVRVVSDQFNSATTERHYRNEVVFSFHNHREIMNAMEEGRAVDLATLPKHPRTSALLIGSGPSLDEALPLLKDWKGHIICSTSQAPTLLAWGREPEHIVALDPDSNQQELFAEGDWKGRKTVLHIHPGVTPGLVKWWPGKIALYRKLQPQQPFYAGEQAMGYSAIGGKGVDYRYHTSDQPIGITAQVPMLANVMPAQICIGKHLGYSQMVLVGVDFSFPDDKERFTSQVWDGSQWIENKPISLEDYYTQTDSEKDPLVETELDGLITTGIQIFYSYQTIIACRLVERSVINTSSKGLLRILPYVPIKKVIQEGNKGVKGFTHAQQVKACEEYLAQQNIYFFYVGQGIMPHEFKDPLHDIPMMLKELKASLVAQGKGDMLDVEANTKRINRLFQTVAEG